MRASFFRIVLLLFLVCFFATIRPVSAMHAAQSTITEAEGYACMGDDKSRKQTEAEALTTAKRKAVEYASTFIKSETKVKDLQLEKDIIDAYSRASVRIVQEVERAWYRDPSSGDCFKIRIKAEVVPDEQVMTQFSGEKSVDEPNAPLNVQVWTDKKAYRQSEKVKIFIKGNKPFYARVLYRDVKGGLLQLLPNPYRTDNYFNGGVVYEIPSGADKYELEVSPPFGEENIIVYASSSPLGDISLKDTGGLYKVKTSSRDVGTKTRGVKLTEKGDGAGAAASEFFERKAVLKTGQ
jgi:hypothetical protein